MPDRRPGKAAQRPRSNTRAASGWPSSTMIAARSACQELVRPAVEDAAAAAFAAWSSGATGIEQRHRLRDAPRPGIASTRSRCGRTSSLRRRGVLRPLWRLGNASNLLVHRQFARLAADLIHSSRALAESRTVLSRVAGRLHRPHYTPRAIVHHHRKWTRRAAAKAHPPSGRRRRRLSRQRIARYGDLRSLLELLWHRPRTLVQKLRRATKGKSEVSVVASGVEFAGQSRVRGVLGSADAACVGGETLKPRATIIATAGQSRRRAEASRIARCIHRSPTNPTNRST